MMGKQQKVTFMRDMKKVGGKQLSRGGDEGATAAARAAGRECGQEARDVLDFDGTGSAPQELSEIIVAFMTERLDPNWIEAKVDNIPVENRPSFISSLVAAIMT